jgi:hypothetical protein
MGKAGIWASVVALVACHGATGSAVPGSDASLSSSDSALSDDLSSDDSTLQDAFGGDDGQPGDSGELKVPCDPHAGAATSACALPLSVCTDSGALVSYMGGSCVAGWCSWEEVDTDCTMVGGTCGAAPRLDAGQEGDAALAFLAWGPDGGSGCVVPVAPGPDPSPVACDPDAGVDAALCPPPPSVCDDSRWLVYYDLGECVSGLCAWQKMYRACPNGFCARGACMSGITAPAAN